MLCQHNILHHAFLHAFRRHRALLSVDPATQRGRLPPALRFAMPDAKQHIDVYAMLVELRYMDVSVISPPLSIKCQPSAVIDDYPCLTSALEPGQKIKFRLDRDGVFADHLSFAVTIVRKTDAKCKRIFEFPSPSEEFYDAVDKAILFDCPSAPELEHRDPGCRYLTRCESGLQVHLGIARDTQYPYTQAEAECVEIYSYSDDGDRLADGIQETLMRLQYVGIWF